MTEQHDLSDAEIIRSFEECGRDPVRLWRVAVAHTSRAEMHKGLINGSDQYDIEVQS